MVCSSGTEIPLNDAFVKLSFISQKKDEGTSGLFFVGFDKQDKNSRGNNKIAFGIILFRIKGI
jgi:hypothetical protein